MIQLRCLFCGIIINFSSVRWIVNIIRQTHQYEWDRRGAWWEDRKLLFSIAGVSARRTTIAEANSDSTAWANTSHSLTGYSIYHNSHNASVIRCLPIPVFAKCTTDANHVAYKNMCSFRRNQKAGYYWCIMGIVMWRIMSFAPVTCDSSFQLSVFFSLSIICLL